MQPTPLPGRPAGPAYRYRYKHIVVVHGIGDQAPNETALGFMNEFIRALPQDASSRLTVLNLVESVDRLMAPPAEKGAPPRSKAFQPANIVYSHEESGITDVNVIGFSEVYWQPIAEYYIRENGGNLPIPIFTWARSITTRLPTSTYDFAQWRSAIENLETILKLLKNLAFISDKTKLFAYVTEKFLGDVQLYAESDTIRQKINEQFFHVLARVEQFASESAKNILKSRNQLDSLRRGASEGQVGDPRDEGSYAYLKDFAQFKEFESREIYVVAHSEGTVVAYNSLVQAAMVRENQGLHQFDDEYARAKESFTRVESEAKSDWFPTVAGLVTLGSPLDKHFVIWRSRFRKYFLAGKQDHRIQWENYADKNDPVAYELTELQTREFKDLPTDAERLFDADDHMFQRYPIPGKAHIDYWTDRAILRRIVHLMKLAPGQPSRLSDGLWAPFLPLADWALYLGGRALTLFLGIFFLSKLLSTGLAGDFSAWWLVKWIQDRSAVWPFAEGHATFNQLLFLAVPLLLIKGTLELEKFLRSPSALLTGLRWALCVAWAIVALSLYALWAPGHGAQGSQDVLGYGIGLVVLLLVWNLQTCVHKGLVQLWRYTRVL